MNKSTFIIVACGFFFALLAATAVQMLSGKNKHEEVSGQSSQVLVAAKDLAIGEELMPNTTTWATWPQESVSPNAIVRVDGQSASDALKGRTRRAIAKGEPMQKSALVDDTQSNFVAASLEPGKRAVSMNVNAQTSVAGFVSPGDHVDVILTYNVQLPDDDKIRKEAMPVVSRLASETILENLKVLATDQSTGKKTDAKVGKTVTVQVDPHQAEQLVLAAKMGTLSLVLRSLGDESKMASAKDHEMTTDMRLSGVIRELLKGQNKTGSPAQVVRVYSGTRVENVEVRPYTSLR